MREGPQLAREWLQESGRSLLGSENESGTDITVCPIYRERFAPGGNQLIRKLTGRTWPVKSPAIDQAVLLFVGDHDVEHVASLPLKVEVRVFPSLETFEVTVIITWPPFFIVDSIVSAPTRFTETVSA